MFGIYTSYRFVIIFLYGMVGCMFSSCNQLHSNMYRSQSTNMPIGPNTQLGKFMNPGAKEIPCLTILFFT
ncbi:hypothetical protein DK880_00367 [Candidatus Cardinium hertigii]|uniref:Uncharacterized protein n=1 Tax=Candidatus Cardinium hertigii TaxID=247481 RepID=A0A2Z3LGR6_9BACT|nr:hypothetical protein DK880_00367 [Candidatus Cardinium hertigii]